MSLNNEFITSFLIGGTMVAAITYFIKQAKPEIGAILWSIPTLLIPTLLILWKTNVEKTKIINFLIVAMPYMLLTIAWVISFIICLKKMHFMNALACSFVSWGVIALIFYILRVHYYMKKLVSVK